jgi:hypothetical protein
MASASLLTLPEVMPATEIRPSLVAYTECYPAVSIYDHELVAVETYLLGQRLHLLGFQTSVCEHTDLNTGISS